MGYLQLLKLHYVTLCEKYARSERPYLARTPEFWASRSTTGLVFVHGFLALFLFVLFGGGLAQISRMSFVASGAALAVLAIYLQIQFVESADALKALREQLSAETTEERKARYLKVGVIRWSSFLVLLAFVLRLVWSGSGA
jgi:hypothetical protein